MHKQWVNGAECSTIDTRDRGLSYGDGVFETMVHRNNELEHWLFHYDRLKHGCDKLKIRCPREQQLADEIASCVTAASQHQIIKLILTRGIGTRGYRTLGSEEANRILIQSDWPDYPDDYASQGINIHICDTRLSHQPLLAGIKHLNRLEQVIARSEWNDEYTEGLMLDQKGHVIEGTMSNLFISHDGKTLLTPKLDDCGVQGIQRRIIMTKATDLGIPVSESTISLDEVLSAKAVFLTNRIIGIWPVKQIKDQCFEIHPLIKHLQNALGLLREESL